ncbi:unnamed protein product [Amoebophrya sp. A120]|nr:unnamed protein product [Amoebophrya sp. A120]|eukprot:GSA120T00012588001.1
MAVRLRSAKRRSKTKLRLLFKNISKVRSTPLCKKGVKTRSEGGPRCINGLLLRGLPRCVKVLMLRIFEQSKPILTPTESRKGCLVYTECPAAAAAFLGKVFQHRTQRLQRIVRTRGTRRLPVNSICIVVESPVASTSPLMCYLLRAKSPWLLHAAIPTRRCTKSNSSRFYRSAGRDRCLQVVPRGSHQSCSCLRRGRDMS